MQSDDVVLSLTSGGCNLLDMLLDGPRKVVGVDLNPCQNHLVELKKAAIKRLDYEDVWKMFGEGKHENIRELYRLHLQPFLPQVRRRQPVCVCVRG
jgi:betaine lipid synthase